MSERETYRLQGLARAALQEIITKSGTEGEPSSNPVAVLTDTLLRKLASGGSARNPNLPERKLVHQLANAVLTAASKEPRNKPHWAATAMAVLHVVERLLGKDPHGDTLANLAPQIRVHRHRSGLCGTYSTPDFIADEVVHDLFSEFDFREKNGILIADLSVEAAHFPLSTLAHNPQCPVHFYGIDRDPVAISVARRIMSWATRNAANDGFQFHAANCDSILEALPRRWPHEFDAIVGNPPWKTLHSTDDKQFRAKFSNHLSGHFDVYLAFILRANELLKDGGLLSMIIPSGFLFNRNASSVRQMLLSEYEILSLKLFPRRSFIELPCVTPISFLARKRPPRGKMLTRVSYRHGHIGCRPNSSQRFKATSVWKRLPGHVFHPGVRERDLSLAYMRGDAVIGELGVLCCGAMLAQRPSASTPVPFVGFHARHFRSFHACHRFAIEYKRHRKIFHRAPPIQFLNRQKVFFQDVRCMTLATRLVAAVSGTGTLAVNTASMFVPHRETNVEFFAALLNSHLANAWYKLRDSNRDVRLSVLRELPVVIDELKWNGIAEIARQISAIRSFHHRYLDSCSVRHEERILGSRFGRSWTQMIKLQADLNAKIFELYRVSETNQRSIQRLAQMRVF